MRYIYLIIGIIAIVIRFIQNFYIEIIPGINGGYYPVQIRELLNTGQLGFLDMPLLFYLNVFFVKISSFFFQNYDVNSIIINTSKTIDCISLPLLLFPLYLINKNIFKIKLSYLYEIGIIGFSVLSFSPLYLTSDLQKNTLAIPMLLLILYYFLYYLKEKTKKTLLIIIALLIIIGLTHFGVFIVCVCFIIIGLVIFFHRKALFPILVISLLSIVFVGLFDTSRAVRLIFFLKDSIGHPAFSRVIVHLPSIFNLISSFILIGLIINIFKTQRNKLPEFNRKVLILFLCLLLILSFPLINFEFSRRLGLMLFIPQSLVLLIIYPYLKSKIKFSITVLLILIISTSLIYNFSNLKTASINEEAYNDLKKMKNVIPNPNETIIFVRHGLDWWVAWELKAKIAISHDEIVVINEEINNKYKNIMILIQKKGENKLYPAGKSPFVEPIKPEQCVNIYNSEYFDMCQIK